MSEIKKQIVTAAGPNMASIMTNYALPTFEAYAEQWGYTVKSEVIGADNPDSNTVIARAARWHKIGAMRRALEESDIVAWFDSDILILRQDEDIASHIEPGAFQALAIENVPSENRYNPNTGVWVMKSSTEAFDFLDVIESIGMPTRGKWADQGAVMKALGWKLGDVDDNYRWAGPGRGSRFTEGTSWLPMGWNQAYLKRRTNAEACIDRPSIENPHALHFMGMAILEREHVMSSMSSSLGFVGEDGQVSRTNTA